MRRMIAIAILLGGAAAGGCGLPGFGGTARAQPSPMSSGPVGTPMTPEQLGGWCFTGSISAAEARADARSQGFEAVRGLHQDDYGDWFGHSTRGSFVVFPDGRAFPL